MSKLVLSENLFLEVAELKRMNKFLKEDGYIRLVKSIIKSAGIVQDSTNSYFKVTAQSGARNLVMVNAGLAFDTSLEGIVLKEATTLSIDNNGMNHWIVLSRATTNYEDGTVAINADGSIVGTSTKFLDVLRGQPNFPVKVKFNSSNNTGEYEVVSVTNDTNAALSGSFTQESGLKYSVIGCFTPGFVPLSENKNIYEYDSCSLRVVDSEDRPSVTEDEFILAMVSFDATGSMNISDERIYYMFNNPYNQNGSDTVTASNPLASLISVKNVGICGKSAEFEMVIEHGYQISKFELVQTTSSNVFNILQGSCNYLGTGDIPNGMFEGWLLLNRKNMKYAEVSTNENKSLYVPVFDTSMIEDEGNDFIVIPNFLNIEFMVKLSNNVDYPQYASYELKSIPNVVNRIRFQMYFPSLKVGTYEDNVTVTVKYRMIDRTGKKYPYNNLAIAQFDNVNGYSETLSASSYVVDIKALEPEETLRNYS